MSEQQFDPQEWITTAEAAALTGYSKENLVKARKRGLLDAIKRGGVLFFRSGDVLDYAETMKSKGTQKYIPKIYRD